MDRAFRMRVASEIWKLSAAKEYSKDIYLYMKCYRVRDSYEVIKNIMLWFIFNTWFKLFTTEIIIFSE